MKNFKNMARKFWNDESGQGMAEYVLLVVVVVGVAMLFKEKIIGMVRGKLDSVSTQFNDFSSQ